MALASAPLRSSRLYPDQESGSDRRQPHDSAVETIASENSDGQSLVTDARLVTPPASRLCVFATGITYESSPSTTVQTP